MFFVLWIISIIFVFACVFWYYANLLKRKYHLGMIFGRKKVLLRENKKKHESYSRVFSMLDNLIFSVFCEVFY